MIILRYGLHFTVNHLFIPYLTKKHGFGAEWLGQPISLVKVQVLRMTLP